ncbi:hypothetical protein SAMN02745206_03773 [Desulfacinum infernum DSM 9756]|uniref:Uncharacterized protein n=1 Tax=Desulfacinum infernum DSM 9756 TaxID=1121391 RepID=A0A1M5JF95_9BACT|nr:hypothetical protein [Desulfacinum infernum]SHG39252.1 hypothetical protein SAMN02745206_03773 [Desulfacinum infernum DSM 9756]
MVEQVSGLFGILARILDVFQQKAYVYVDVTFGADVPYCLTVLNRSSFDILLLHLLAIPDGFPTTDNGWRLNQGSLFKNKILKPGQKIRVLLRHQDIGELTHRKFKIEYCTLLRGRQIPRLQQTCEHEFISTDHTVTVVASVKTAWNIHGDETKT